MPTVNAKYISIFVTTDCDLGCSYCYAQQGRDNNVIDVEFAKVAIDDFFSKYPHRGIRFQGGGEPTLRLNAMREILDYSRSKWGEVNVELQTHGAFDKETLKWITDNVDIVWVSHDGLPDVQNIHRPDMQGGKTNLVVENNIKSLIKSGLTVGIRCCITTLNVHRQVEIVDYLSSLGVKTIYGDNIFSTDANEYMNQLYSVPSWQDYTEGFIKAKKRAKKIGVFYGSWLTVNFHSETTHNCSSCIPFPRLTTDGYVSSCDVTSLGKDGPDIFIYGKWNSITKQIDYNKKQSVLLNSRSLENLDRCKHCSIGPYCAGSCAGKVYLKTGSLFTMDHETCEATKRLAHYLPLGMGKEEHEIEHP